MRAIFLDLETTGLDPFKHVTIDIALKVVDLRSNVIIGSYQSIVKHSLNIWEEKDPSSIEINGFTFDLIEKGKEQNIISDEVVAFLQSYEIQKGNAVFICQNPSFDRAFFSKIVNVYIQEKLNWPYHWLDLASMYWTVINQQSHALNVLLPSNMNLSKNTIATAYHLPEEENPHRAMNGVNHLIKCYQAVLNLNQKII